MGWPRLSAGAPRPVRAARRHRAAGPGPARRRPARRQGQGRRDGMRRKSSSSTDLSLPVRKMTGNSPILRPRTPCCGVRGPVFFRCAPARGATNAPRRRASREAHRQQRIHRPRPEAVPDAVQHGVLQRQDGLGMAGIALAAAAAFELAVDAGGLVPLGQDDVQAAGLARGVRQGSVPRPAMLVAIMMLPISRRARPARPRRRPAWR